MSESVRARQRLLAILLLAAALSCSAFYPSSQLLTSSSRTTSFQKALTDLNDKSKINKRYHQQHFFRDSRSLLFVWGKGRRRNVGDKASTTSSGTVEESKYKRIPSKNDDEGDNSKNEETLNLLWLLPSMAMIGLPLLSAYLFPAELSWAKELPANSPQQLQVVALLFVSSRAILYLQGMVIVTLAARRSATQDAPQLGQRLVGLTEELLYRPDLSKPNRNAQGLELSGSKTLKQQSQKPQLVQSLADSGVQETLNQVSSSQQALVLPILVSALLTVSVFLVPFWTTAGTTTGTTSASYNDSGTVELVRLLLQNVLPFVTRIWNAGILTLFTRAELRQLIHEVSSFFKANRTAMSIQESKVHKVFLPALEWGLALAVTGVACLSSIFPLQNFVNMALAITVARAIQLNQFQAVVGALALLTLYDASSVFLIPAASATSAYLDTTLFPETTNLLSSGGSSLWMSDRGIADSAMGSVAIQKLSSGTFQPGLLVTKIGNNRFLGGSLGLGDAVFPSLMAGLAYRFDLNRKITIPESDEYALRRSPLLPASLVGYILGCAACDLVPSSIVGLPALIFITPTMLGAVLLVAWGNDEWDPLWNFDADYDIRE